MARRRLSISALTAILILGLTALDLGSDVFESLACPLCAAEEPAVTTVGPLVPDSTGDQDVHRDDCFCCSHCVRPTASFTLEGDGQVRHVAVTPPPGVPSAGAGALFHPPRTA